MCQMPWFNTKVNKVLPCGGCFGCRADRLALWSQRCSAELASFGGKASFLTLTYDEYHLPYAPEGVLPSLCKEHLVKFFDALKTAFPKHKRLAVGEYGDSFERPHYHALVYGMDWHDFAPYFEKHWIHGSTKSLPVAQGSVRYVLDYMNKNINGPLAVERYDKTLRERPFFVVSNNFGKAFFESRADEINRTGFLTIGSRLVPVPTYYKNMYCQKDSASILSREEFVRERLFEPLRRKALRSGYKNIVEFNSARRNAEYVSDLFKTRLDGIPLDVRYSLSL